MGMLDILRAAVDSFGPIPTPERGVAQHIRPKPPEVRKPEVDTSALARAIAGGRITRDEADKAIGFFGFLAPFATQNKWSIHPLDLGSKDLEKMEMTELMELLADVSPDLSRALWDFLRMTNPGWEVKAFRPNSDTEDKRAQDAVDAFMAMLKDYYGSVDVVISHLFISAWLRGAFLAELVLDEAGRMPVDLAIPDPISVRFRRIAHEVRGPIWQLCQMQNGGIVALDRETIRYIPIDPFPGHPYGRPLAAPAVSASLFLLGLLHDLRRVVSQQGWPRIDIEINLEALMEAMPEDLQEDPAESRKWIEQAVGEVKKAYAALKPDDAYAHTSIVKVNRPVGAVDSSSLGAVEGLIRGLERMLVRALKTMPLLMALPEGTSEANANRQWEIHAAGIKALQHLCESLLEYMITIALEVQGIQAKVEFRFAELRAAEMLRDEQVRALRNRNIAFEYSQGWIDQDEAAQEAVGHDPVEQEPRNSGQAVALQSDLLNTQPDPGSNRARARGLFPDVELEDVSQDIRDFREFLARWLDIQDERS